MSKNRAALTSEEQTWKSRYTLRLISYGWSAQCASLYADGMWGAKMFQDGFNKLCEKISEQYGVHCVSREDIGNYYEE